MVGLKWLRKAAKFIRGGAGPVQIFLACLLGILIGMTPGVNLTLIAGIVLLLVLNVSFGIALMCFAVGKILAILLAPVTFSVGYFLIHQIGLEGFFSAVADTPIVALFNLTTYCLTGGLVIGLIIGSIIGVILAVIIQKIRHGLIVAQDRSAFLQKVSNKKLYRFLLRALFGKSKTTIAEALVAKHGMIRKSGVIVCMVVVAVFVVGVGVFAGPFLSSAVVDGLMSVNGAEVDVTYVEVSLLSGRIRLNGLQMTDPNKPTHNIFQAERLEGDIGVMGLLAKRFVIDRIAVSNVQIDTPRQTPGEVYPREEPEPTRVPTITGEDVLGYFQKAKEYKKYLDYLSDVRWSASRKEEPADQEALRRRAEAEGYWSLSADESLSRRPAVTIRELSIEKIHADQGELAIKGKELSSDPALNEQPLELRVLGVNVPDMTDKCPVQIQQGIADITLNGKLVDGVMHWPLEVVVRDLKASPRSGRSVLGMNAAAAKQLFSGLNKLTLLAELYGPMDSPRIRVDQSGTLEALKADVGDVAKTRLTNEVDSRVKGLLHGENGDKTSDEDPNKKSGILDLLK